MDPSQLRARTATIKRESSDYEKYCFRPIKCTSTDHQRDLRGAMGEHLARVSGVIRPADYCTKLIHVVHEGARPHLSLGDLLFVVIKVI